jgi:hypothetical protein
MRKCGQFASVESRKLSFAGWPAHLSQKPADLAEAGFFYTGTVNYKIGGLEF